MFLTCCIILSDHTIFLIAKSNVSWQSYCINGLTSSFLLELPHNRTRFAILRGSAPYIIKSGPRYNKKKPTEWIVPQSCFWGIMAVLSVEEMVREFLSSHIPLSIGFISNSRKSAEENQGYNFNLLILQFKKLGYESASLCTHSKTKTLKSSRI